MSEPNKSGAGYSAIISKDDIELVIDKSCGLCTACDPKSSVPHTVQVTRFRVANLCCAGEEKIIRSTLEGKTGIESISVNVIGRYLIIKHCATACCAPVATILDLLNAKRLGVTVQELADSTDSSQEDTDYPRIFHVVLVCLLFVVGLILQFLHGTGSMSVYICSTAIGILPILYSCYVSIIRRTIDIHILIVIAVAGALAAAEYFDASLVVSLFITAELIESIVMAKIRQAVNSNVTPLPKEAFLVDGSKVKLEDLKIGDILAVRVGEMVLGDGVVVKGQGVVDESALTGESVPISKKKDSVVRSGTVVQNGYLEISLTSDFKSSTLSKLNQAILDVQAEQGEYSKLLDQFSIYWTPGVLVATLLLVLIGGGVSGEWYVYTFRGLVLLVLACPCAIVIAAPIPSVCAIVTASKYGVLIRGPTVIERMSVIQSVAVDKTGTLTKGLFRVSEKLLLSDDADEDPSQEKLFDPLQLAAAVEQKSTHPLANAVVAEFCGCIAEMDESSMKMPNVKKMQVVEGVGLTGWVEVEDDWKFVAIGNERLLKAHGGKVTPTTKQQQLLDEFMKRSSSKVVLLVAVDDQLELVLSLSDELRNETVQFISTLKNLQLSVAMLTGDQQEVAQTVCQQVGIDEANCKFRLLPNQKLEWIQNKQNQDNLNVLMVGDGINDSTALTAASVGVAMGAGGTAMAVAAADVILMTDNLMLLPSAIELCRAAKTTMIQSFVFAIGIKIVAIVLAILGHLNFWQAIVIDIGSLLVVMANGVRPLYSWKEYTKL